VNKKDFQNFQDSTKKDFQHFQDSISSKMMTKALAVAGAFAFFVGTVVTGLGTMGVQVMAPKIALEKHQK
jgi:hypothetical protein